jgi:hypothetical protein
VTSDDSRLRYAKDVLGDLFPGTAVNATQKRQDVDITRTFALAPTSRHPRLLVPMTPRDAAAGALRAYGGRLTRHARWSYRAAAMAVAATGPAILRGRVTATSPEGRRTAGIDDHLSDVLSRPISVAVHLTPDRANRKPIIQALDAGQPHPVAFAKMGVNELTSRLVNEEANALELLAARSLRALVVPTIVHHGEFAGRSVLTLNPLPTWQSGRSPVLTEVAAAAREVAATAAPRRLPLEDSRYWLEVRRRVEELPRTARAERLTRCVEQMTELLGAVDTTFTASHGDWSPWNMWLTPHGLLVWDWERYETEIPAGFDLLHFRLNEQLVRAPQNRSDAAFRLIADAPELLEVAGCTTESPLAAVLLYLVHIGLRYESDGQAGAGAAVGHLESWLLPAVESALASSVRSEGA